MKGSDAIAALLRTKVEHCFGLQGGAVVHIFDSCQRCGPKPIYCHHEVGAAFSAVSYARIHGYGVCVTTTGPGATNALTGVLAAFQDSIPCLFISGQTRAEHTSYGKPVRQVGSQEYPIVELVRPMTKLALFVKDRGQVEKSLLLAFKESQSGRPGPAWLDISLTAQWTE